MSATVVYRPMTDADLPAALALSEQLKWPHRLDDWAMLLRLSLGFVALDDERLMGTAFTCPQGDYATIGLVIVSSDYQGKGIGRALMELVLDACQTRTPILNATRAGALLYVSQGFVEFGQIAQHQGLAHVPALQPLVGAKTCRPLRDADKANVLELANAATGMERGAVINELLGIAKDSVGIEHNGRLCAFAMLRVCGRGLSIGPVVAENLDQARHLIGVLLAQVPGEFVRVDIPADCGLGDWLETVGLMAVDSVTQMARGGPPRVTGDVRQFALVSQAIG
ncbi:GNAT family N-acetyltransferase [Pseudomonas prosekii]|uniref:GNAT family N-acetyltransferase n=1 Tax=Pseudomonas prosekii TaxID=1148509 RepID=A0A3L8CT50_9PSED|nr:GNAT family N-acetyltransferase [Pseudomonas prosekii]RLU11372.1 GNAT family N-acetyltransferase [Pseudomonas prosekii]RLU14333.1 GNAT family N-acetyltransferase [Pseudomonas prosekii]